MLILADLYLLIISGIYVLISWAIPIYLVKNKKVTKYWARKFVHTFSGLSVFVIPYLNYPELAFILSVFIALVMYFATGNNFLKPLYNSLAEKEELHLGYLQGPFAYALAIAVLMVFTIFLQGREYFIIAAVLVMVFADTAASIIGSKYGKHKISIPYIGNKRTIEGTVTFFIVSLVVSFITYYFVGYYNPGNSIPLSLNLIFILTFTTAFLGSLLELLSPSKWDDLLVPIGTVVTLILIFN